MWELDHKEDWVLKNWCFWTVVLEKTLESPLDRKAIKPVNPKGSQPWIFIGRTEAAAPLLWPPDVKSTLTGKDPDAGKDWRQERRMTEDEMVGWHHWLVDMSLGNLQEVVKDRVPGMLWSTGSQRVRHNWVTEQSVLNLVPFSPSWQCFCQHNFHKDLVGFQFIWFWFAKCHTATFTILF